MSKPHHMFLVIRDGCMVHVRNQHEQKRKQSSHVLPSITCGPFGSMVYNRTNMKQKR